MRLPLLEYNKMIESKDTICAISTPPGVGGIAVIRISGPQAINVADRCWKGISLKETISHTAHLGTVIDTDSSDLDQAVATVFRAPRSFTGEDTVELAVHGSRYVQRRLLEILCASGARLAEPGEFTRRAFTNGRMDLAQAEAVADVIASTSRSAHRIAVSQMRGGFSRRLASLRENLLELASLLELELDFSEEDVEFASRTRLREIASQLHSEITRLHRSFVAGNAIKDGIPVAIVGPANAGKSSLLNALLDDDRAIISDIPGTTRDTIEETLEIGDYLFRFIDTAGIRETSDSIERIGIDRSLKAIAKARIIIAVIDTTVPLPVSTLEQAASPLDETDNPPHLVIAINKNDLAGSATPTDTEAHKFAESHSGTSVIRISALDGSGLDTLRNILVSHATQDAGAGSDDILVTNARHAEALALAAESTARILDGLDTQLPPDLIAQDVRQTIHHLSSITGDIPSSEILATIFSRFCIGK